MGFNYATKLPQGIENVTVIPTFGEQICNLWQRTNFLRVFIFINRCFIDGF